MLFENRCKCHFGIFLLLIVSGFATIAAQDSIDTRIILQAGPVAITEYELQKNRKVYEDIFLQEKGHMPGKTDLLQWIHAFSDRTLFLADAFQKGYDTSRDINLSVKSMECYMIARPGGLLEEKLLSQVLPIQEEELKTALQRTARKSHIRYIRFPDYNRALSFLQGKIVLISPKEFDSLLFQSQYNKEITTGEDALQWPFLKRGEREEVILNLKEGEVSSLLQLSDGYYLAHVLRIEHSDIKDLTDSLKKQVAAILLRNRRKQFLSDYHATLEEKAHIEINPAFLTAMEKQIGPNTSIRVFDKQKYSVIPSPVMEYELEGQTVKVSPEEFMDYYNKLVLRRPIENMEILVFYIRSMALEECIYRRAVALGITSEQAYVANRDNYKKNVIAAAYEWQELRKDISVTEAEIREKYEQEKSGFVQASGVILSIFSFQDRASAMPAVLALERNQADSIAFAGAKDIAWHCKTDYGEGILSDSIQAVVFSMKDGRVTRPVYSNGKFIVIRKESEYGKRIKELSEVKEVIRKALEDKKLEEKKKMYLPVLKAKFTLKDKIDYPGY
jgi:hypothetical protein